jgi:hypothetical protein
MPRRSTLAAEQHAYAEYMAWHDPTIDDDEEAAIRRLTRPVRTFRLPRVVTFAFGAPVLVVNDVAPVAFPPLTAEHMRFLDQVVDLLIRGMINQG